MPAAFLVPRLVRLGLVRSILGRANPGSGPGPDRRSRPRVAGAGGRGPDRLDVPSIRWEAAGCSIDPARVAALPPAAGDCAAVLGRTRPLGRQEGCHAPGAAGTAVGGIIVAEGIHIIDLDNS